MHLYATPAIQGFHYGGTDLPTSPFYKGFMAKIHIYEILMFTEKRCSVANCCKREIQEVLNAGLGGVGMVVPGGRKFGRN